VKYIFLHPVSSAHPACELFLTVNSLFFFLHPLSIYIDQYLLFFCGSITYELDKYQLGQEKFPDNLDIVAGTFIMQIHSIHQFIHITSGCRVTKVQQQRDYPTNNSHPYSGRITKSLSNKEIIQQRDCRTKSLQ